ncbi:MAG TPA: class I SAM-dependent methyltransferase [Microbacteriaceae bacterium]|nr:class I SAM-dependent methyltransferase [Microbacteriaceae bacterium]
MTSSEPPGERSAPLAATSFAHRVLGSPIAPIAVFPWRFASAAGKSLGTFGATTRWLFGSRENTNYTYDLTPRNREHLAWFVAHVAGIPLAEARGYLQEVLDDEELAAHVAGETRTSRYRWLADRVPRYGRRIGWYAFVRALKPDVLVETGTDKGLGSVVLAAALLRNGKGRLTSIDINPAAGYLISGRYAEVTDLVISDSIQALGALREVDLFIHDSDHTAEHEYAEFTAIAPNLRPDGLVLSDNSHATDSMPRWAEETGREFLFFDERPARHWYPGAGIGTALPPA